MSDKPERTEEEVNDKGYVPASPLKRTLAWVGLAYAVLFLILTTYFFYTGTMLGNLAPLLTIPGLIGMGIYMIISWRTTGRPEAFPAILIATVCFLLALMTVPIAIAGVMSNFPADATVSSVTVVTPEG